MKIYNTEVDWNNKYKCDAFIEITILPSIDIDMLVGVKLIDDIITIGKCIQKIETKIDKLTDLVCLVNSGYNKHFFIDLLKKMHPNVSDWQNKIIYIYTFTTKFSIKNKMELSPFEKKFYSY